jgi:hypothetical protein
VEGGALAEAGELAKKSRKMMQDTLMHNKDRLEVRPELLSCAIAMDVWCEACVCAEKGVGLEGEEGRERMRGWRGDVSRAKLLDRQCAFARECGKMLDALAVQQ